MADEQTDRTKVLMEQYKTFIDVYKQHFDLFLKGVLAYLAAISVVAGFIFGKDAPQCSKLALSALIPFASLVAVFGCLKSRRWVLDLQVSIRAIEEELKVQPFPFSGPKGIILTVVIASLTFFGFGIANIVLQVVSG